MTMRRGKLLPYLAGDSIPAMVAEAVEVAGPRMAVPALDEDSPASAFGGTNRPAGVHIGYT